MSPVPFADEVFMHKVEERIVQPTVNGLIARGIDYRGFIFLGLIEVDGEPMVIEYNVRMGDPETEVVMLRIESDLVALMKAAAEGNLGDMPMDIDPRTAVTVMLVSGGYPGSYPKGMEITGLEALLPAAGGKAETIPFHAGTALKDGRLLTSGGRVIALSSYGDMLPDAAEAIASALSRSYDAAGKVCFDGKYFRRDIGRDLMALASGR